MSFIESVFLGTGLILYVLVLREIVPHRVRQVPLLLAYVLAVLFAAILQTAAQTAHWSRHQQSIVYWSADTVHHVLLYAFLISVLYNAISYLEHKHKLRHQVLVLSIGVMVVSFASHYSERFSMLMTLFSRDLEFGAAILTISSWMALRLQNKSHPIMRILAAIGIQMTGGAIGHAVRYLSHLNKYVLYFGNYFLVITHLLSFYFLWKALKAWEVETERATPEWPGVQGVRS